MPPGIGVCEDCRWVFRHSPKRAAAKCPRCNRRSRRAERQPWHLAVIEDETFARVETFDRCMLDTRQVVRGEVFDPGGAPSGVERRYLVQCVACSAPPFWAERADHKYCSPRCRVRAHRGAIKRR